MDTQGGYGSARRLLVLLGVALMSLAQLSCAGESAWRPANYAYVLQANKLRKDRDEAVAALAGCGRDLVIMDAKYAGTKATRWRPEEIARIKAGQAGRKVICYLSIGEAEIYRPYWKKAWDADGDGQPDQGAPPFLLTENPKWKGNYKVKYWDPAWQAIIQEELARIQAQGFDGVFLDIVDGFEFFEFDGENWNDDKVNDETKNTYRRDMIAWVQAIAAAGRARDPDFLVVPQNGSQLLEHPDYVRTISALALEDLFTRGDEAQEEEHVQYILGFAHRARMAGKPVLLTSYASTKKLQARARAGAAEHGLVLLITDRPLATLGASGVQGQVQ